MGALPHPPLTKRRGVSKCRQRDKGGGYRGIINELFIYAGSGTDFIPRCFVQFCFRECHFPNEWTKQLLVPLHKKQYQWMIGETSGLGHMVFMLMRSMVSLNKGQ